MKITIKQITYTAVLLALLIAIQQLKGLSQYITGSVVNAILVVSSLYLGLFSGMILAVLSPVFAFIINPSMVLQALPQMTPTIIIGNTIIVLFAYFFKTNKNLMAWLTVGSLAKAGFLWVAVFFIIKTFGENLQPAMVTALTATFSVNQAITAIIGSLIAFFIWRAIKDK